MGEKSLNSKEALVCHLNDELAPFLRSDEAPLSEDMSGSIPDAAKPDSMSMIVALSGGLDSIVLLHLCVRLLGPSRISALHIHHHLQTEADEWALFCAEECAALGVNLAVKHVYPERASEDAARNVRYQAFTEALTDNQILLTAHHANDQTETLLFRLARGTGAKGLQGIRTERALGQGRIVRPLLSVSRQHLETYAESHGLSWIEDPSNCATEYDRNYLRHEVMPAIEQRWPLAVEQFSKAAEHLATADQVLEGYLRDHLDGICGRFGELSLDNLLALPKAHQRLLLKQWLSQVSGISPSLVWIDNLLSQSAAPADKNIVCALTDGVVRRYKGCLFWVDNIAPIVAIEYHLKLGQIDLGDGTLSVDTAADQSGIKTLDGVVIKRRKGGEMIRLASNGMQRKVKKILQEANIPPWLRENWPLAYYADQVVAIPNIAVAQGWDAENGGYALFWASRRLSERL